MKIILKFCLVPALFIAVAALAGPPGPSLVEDYRFERLWPPLQAPWYFRPKSIATDAADNIYLSDLLTRSIRKYNANGQQISVFGENSGGLETTADNEIFVASFDGVRRYNDDGMLLSTFGSAANDVAVAPDGSIFVTHFDAYTVRKYGPDEQLLFEFGGEGVGDGQFTPGPGLSGVFCSSVCPLGIDADQEGNVYVTDLGASRIQKFNSDGEFLLAFGTPDSDFDDGPGEFRRLLDVTVAPDGSVHVPADSRVQIFDDQGQLLDQYGTGRFATDFVAIDTRNFRFASEPTAFSGSVQVYDASGAPSARWTSRDEIDGFFDNPVDIAVTQGVVFVVDNFNQRVQRFDTSGAHLQSLGPGDPGNLFSTRAVAASATGNVYVAEFGNNPAPAGYRIKRFQADGTFISQFFLDSFPVSTEIFGLGVGPADNLYVAYSDAGTAGVQKFSPEGNHLQTFDFSGDGPGQSRLIVDVAVGNDGTMHMLSVNPVKVFSADANGNFLRELTREASTEVEISGGISNITVDPDGNLVIGESNGLRLVQLDPQLNVLSEYDAPGFDPGQFNSPQGVAFDAQGLMYVAESGNNRVQVLSPNVPGVLQKAVVVAGGGPYPGNSLWDATRLNANFAYRALQFQGLDKATVQYLSADTEVDLDGNGIADDVDADASVANLMAALDPTTGFASDADELVIYLVDHGGENTFRMSETETLGAAEFATWIDAWQAATGNPVTIIYDACQSGSFVDDLASTTFTRTIIASSGADENAYFVSGGALSFSYYFFTQIFSGADLQVAYELASQAISNSFDRQSPRLNVDGAAAPSSVLAGQTLGNGLNIVGDRPTIGSTAVSPNPISIGSSATLSATNVLDNDGISRVWAVLRPPGFSPSAADAPIEDLPTVDLLRNGVSADFSADVSVFNAPGTYVITINAIDNFGNAAAPIVSTVAVESPLRRKAIVVAGGEVNDPLWPAYRANAELAYLALLEQGYGPDGVNCNDDGCDNIQYFSQASGPGVDEEASLQALEEAITVWAADNGQDLALYLVGPGMSDQFRVRDGQPLSAAVLDGWLDTLQSTLPGTVATVVDADFGGSMIDDLLPPTGRQRITIASTDTDGFAALLVDGTVSFSNFFWTQALNGANTREAFLLARQAIRFESDQCQSPQLDDNGNGIANEFADGLLAQNYRVGSGILLAGDGPAVADFSVAETYDGDGPLEVVVPQVVSTGEVTQVLAVVNQTGCRVPRVTQLSLQQDGSYRGDIAGLLDNSGDFNVAVYAQDNDQEVSLPVSKTVMVSVEPALFADGFESF